MYMLGTTTKLSMLFQVLGLLKEMLFLDLGLIVTEINIKKGTQTRLKNHLKCKKM